MSRHRFEGLSGVAARAAIALLAGAFVAGCGAQNSDTPRAVGSEADPPGSTVLAHAGSVFRFESLRDLVSFTDSVVIVRVDGETEESVPEGGAQNGDILGRTVHVSVVDVLYSFPGAPEAPMSFDITANGAFISDDGTPLEIVGEGPRYEVGGQYLVGLVKYDEQTWGALNEGAVFRVVDGIVLGEEGDQGVRAQLSGQSVESVEATLSEEPLNPLVDLSRYVPALRRFADVEHTESGEPTPSTLPVSGPPDVESPGGEDGSELGGD